MKIAKEYRWEMGHRLTFHKGGCESLHGHSYKMLIELAGEKDINGMLLDYFDIDSIVKPILARLDHGFVVYKDDREVIDFLNRINSKNLVLPFQPTAENLCEYILENLKSANFPANIKTLRVRLSETEDVFADETVELGK